MTEPPADPASTLDGPLADLADAFTKIQFEPGTNRLSPGGRSALGTIARLLLRHQSCWVRLRPEGPFYNSTPDPFARAEAIEAGLLRRGVAANRLFRAARPTGDSTVRRVCCGDPLGPDEHARIWAILGREKAS